MGKQLLEVVTNRPRFRTETSERGVIAHRTKTFFAADGHGR